MNVFIYNAGCEELSQTEDKPLERSFPALPLHLQPDSSQPSSPGSGTRCSTPTISLVVGSVVVNPAVKELALELLKVGCHVKRSLLFSVPSNTTRWVQAEGQL